MVAVDKTSGVDFGHVDGTSHIFFLVLCHLFLPVTSVWKILAFPVTGIYSLLGKRDFTFYFLIQILDTSGNMFLDKEISA